VVSSLGWRNSMCRPVFCHCLSSLNRLCCQVVKTWIELYGSWGSSWPNGAMPLFYQPWRGRNVNSFHPSRDILFTVVYSGRDWCLLPGPDVGNQWGWPSSAQRGFPLVRNPPLPFFCDMQIDHLSCVPKGNSFQHRGHVLMIRKRILWAFDDDS